MSLDPRVVDCIVFWTKNPAPMLPCLDEIDRLGHRYFFQFTLTACDRTWKSISRKKPERLAVFRRLAERIGPERVLWRFDPILFTRTQGPDAVLPEFADLAKQLHPFTRQCTISFLSLYQKCMRNLRGVDLLTLTREKKSHFVRQLAAIAGQYALNLKACCDPFLQDQCGIKAARCIDEQLVAAILGQPVRISKDKGQRPGCGCAASIDIGAYNTCPHGCRYCYANVSERAVAVNRAAHDPKSPLLTGTLSGQESITERKSLPAVHRKVCFFRLRSRHLSSPAENPRTLTVMPEICNA